MEVDQNILNQIFSQIGVVTQSVSQLNHDYTSLSQNFATLTANVEWLMKFFWIVATASIGSLIASIWQIVIAKKAQKNGNNK
jgi:uncharacterized protein YoxC